MENNANNIDATIIDTKYDARPINPTMPIGIDLSKYISEDEIMSIVRRIYEEEARNYAKQRLAFMSSNGISIVQMIIKEVANKYAEELAPEYQERFLQICKDELERTESHCEDYNDTIHNSVNNLLTSLASKYINQEYVIRYDLNHNEIARYGSINEMCQAVINAGETRTKIVKTCRNSFNRNRDKIWLGSYWKVITPENYKEL